MIYLFSVIFGVIQGLTEFLPISSTAHLIILHRLWPIEVASDLGYDVVLHGGTLLALLAYFRKDVVRYLAGFFRSFRRWDPRHDHDQRLAWLIIIGSIPAGLIGYAFEANIEEQLRSLWVIVATLFVGAVLFFIVERVSRKNREIETIGTGTAVIVGLAQALALIPGISRSGITIIAGLFAGLKRAAAARFAFLLSIPIIFGAGLKKILELVQQGALAQHPLVYLVGLIASIISGYLCIKYFLRFLQNRSLIPFAYYRLVLGVGLAILLLAGVL